MKILLLKNKNLIGGPKKKFFLNLVMPATDLPTPSVLFSYFTGRYWFPVLFFLLHVFIGPHLFLVQQAGSLEFTFLPDELESRRKLIISHFLNSHLLTLSTEYLTRTKVTIIKVDGTHGFRDNLYSFYRQHTIKSLIFYKWEHIPVVFCISHDLYMWKKKPHKLFTQMNRLKLNKDAVVVLE